jgi:hypothetical protein
MENSLMFEISGLKFEVKKQLSRSCYGFENGCAMTGALSSRTTVHVKRPG